MDSNNSKFSVIKNTLMICALSLASQYAMAGDYKDKTESSSTKAQNNQQLVNPPMDCNEDDFKTVTAMFPHSTTKEPDNLGFQSSTICEFNVWSWQMFLWLTQEDSNGDARFLNFETPYDVLNIESREVLKPNTGHNPFDETVQAGPDGILVDQNGNVVYYSQYLNPTYTQFIKDNNLTDPKAVQAFNANTSFPVNTLELKASWRIVEEGENVDNFFTIEHEIYGLKQKGSQFVIDVNNIRKEKLALVGFHIGGVVKGHPEMIWATFEHVKNSPYVTANFTPKTVVADAESGDYTFFDTNPPKSKPQLTNTYASCNKNYVNSPYMTLNKNTQKMQPVTQVCLQYQYGNVADYNLSKTDSVNKAIQASINTSTNILGYLNQYAQVQLNQEKDVWANYRQIGSIWFKATNALIPNQTFADDFINEKILAKLKQNNSKTKKKVGDQFLIGSLALSNSTIETYTQFASAENNCFRCHNTEQRLLGAELAPLKPMNINISHAFVNMYTWAQEIAAKKN